MEKTVFLDTGPLVAILDKRDQHHLWAQASLSEISGEMVTCESVLSEAIYLTKDFTRAIEAIWGMIDNHILSIESSFSEHSDTIFRRLIKYWDVHTSLADIHLLSLYDDKENAIIFTIDSDFLIYRDSKGKPLHLISPYKSSV
jgi:predicted nucleic acid-binding protein